MKKNSPLWHWLLAGLLGIGLAVLTSWYLNRPMKTRGQKLDEMWQQSQKR